MKNMFNVTTILPHNLLQTNPCSAAQDPHSEVVPRAFWRLVSKSCDVGKGSFARGCEAKRWSHWTCSSLGTIFQPMRINSVPGVKCFCNNKNVLRAQSMVRHFVRHSVSFCILDTFNAIHFSLTGSHHTANRTNKELWFKLLNTISHLSRMWLGHKLSKIS